MKIIVYKTLFRWITKGIFELKSCRIWSRGSKERVQSRCIRIPQVRVVRLWRYSIMQSIRNVRGMLCH